MRFLLSLALLPIAAEANQVWYEPISLAEMTRRSEAVLLVAAEEPCLSTSEEFVSLFTPRFSLTSYRFRLLEVIKNERGHPIAQHITVDMANADTQRELHRAYHQSGLSKSPIYARYGEGARGSVCESPLRDSAVIFVRFHTESRLFFGDSGDNARFEFSVEGAWEADAKTIRQTRALVAKQNRGCGDSPCPLDVHCTKTHCWHTDAIVLGKNESAGYCARRGMHLPAPEELQTLLADFPESAPDKDAFTDIFSIERPASFWIQIPGDRPQVFSAKSGRVISLTDLNAGVLCIRESQ